MTFSLSSELRSQLRDELRVLGVPENDLQMVLDLGVHGVNETLQTLGRVSASAPLHLVIPVQVVASALLHNVTTPRVPADGNYRASAEEMDNALKWAERGRGTWHPGDEVD